MKTHFHRERRMRGEEKREKEREEKKSPFWRKTTRSTLFFLSLSLLLLLSLSLLFLYLFDGEFSRGKEKDVLEFSFPLLSSSVSFIPSWQYHFQEHPDHPVIIVPHQFKDASEGYKLMIQSFQKRKFSLLLVSDVVFQHQSGLLLLLDELEIDSVGLFCVGFHSQMCLQFLLKYPQRVWGSVFLLDFPIPSSSSSSFSFSSFGESGDSLTWNSWLQTFAQLQQQQFHQQQQKQQQKQTSITSLCQNLLPISSELFVFLSFDDDSLSSSFSSSSLLSNCNFEVEQKDNPFDHLFRHFEKFSRDQLLVW